MTSFDTLPGLRIIGTILTMAPLPLLAWVAWSDLVTRTIPDCACIALAVIGIMLRAPAGAWPLGLSVLIAAVTFLALAFIHATGALGGGDIKLATALLLGFPPAGALGFAVITVYAGGVLVLAHLAMRWLPPVSPAPAGAALPLRVWRMERWRVQRRTGLPYGIAIACGGAWTVITSAGS